MGFSCGLLCLQGLLHGLDLPGCESRHLGGGGGAFMQATSSCLVLRPPGADWPLVNFQCPHSGRGGRCWLQPTAQFWGSCQGSVVEV